MGCKHPLDVIVDANFKVDDIVQLPDECVIQLIEAFEVNRVASCQSDFITGQRIDPVMQCQFKDLRYI